MEENITKQEFEENPSLHTKENPSLHPTLNHLCYNLNLFNLQFITYL